MAMFGNIGGAIFRPQFGNPVQDDRIGGPSPSFIPITQAPDTTPQRPGFFAPGGVGRGIAGTVGDALLQLGHMQPVYAPAMEAQREFKMRQQLAQQENQRTLDTEMALYNYKLKNPMPSDDAFTRAVQAAGITPGSPDYVRLSRQRAEALAADPNDQFVATTLPGDRFYAGPKSGLPAALGAITGSASPAPTEGATATNPSTGQRLVFRNGQWAPLTGGTGGNVSGGFP